MILFGSILAVPGTIGFYLSPQACACDVLPIPVGVPLLIPALATVAWWAQRLDGQARPSPAIASVGRAGLLAAGALGLFVLGVQVTELLG